MATSIFGGYDVRAVYPSQLDENKARKVGIAFGNFLKARGIRTCIASRDNRASSESLSKAFIGGLARYSGLNVTNIGLAPSSTLCFALLQNPAFAGASITASHNPVQYNGIKFYSPKAVPLFADELAKIKSGYEAMKTLPKKAAEGKISADSYNETHAQYCASAHRIRRKLKVVVDAGNSVCALVGPGMLEKMGCEVVPLFCTLDSSYPNHLPDPHKRENYAALCRTVKKEKADLGVMFDGDGDRAGFVDEKGNIVDGDFIHILFLRDLLSKKKGATAILDLRLSRAVFEEAKRLGCKAIMSKAGRMAIHEQMEKLRADYGGEVTGHISFAQNGGNDDAFWSAALLGQIISNSKKPLSKMVAQLPHYFSLPELRIACANEKKFAVVEAVKKSLGEKYPKNILTLDGVRLDLPKAWGLARVSNTEAQITLRFEGKTKKDLDAMVEIFGDELKKQGILLRL